jgi:hypothetical protein
VRCHSGLNAAVWLTMRRGNVIETHAQSRLSHFDDCKEIASTRGVRCELSTAATARFWLAQGGHEQTSLLSLQLITEEEIMKKMLLTIALAVVSSFAWGQTLRQPLMKTQDVPKQPQQTTSTTTTTSEEMGTITQYTPGSAIVLRETSGPVHYRFGKTVTYVTRSGKVLDQNTVKTRIKVGVPVRVHYAGTGQNKVVDRVILEHD